MAKGLIDLIDPTDFDALFTSGTVPMASHDVPISGMKLGDWGYLLNDTRYLDKHEHGGYQGENIINVNPGKYFGFPTGPQTLAKWQDDLIAAYNAGLPQADKITSIPGWQAADNQFIDIPKVAMAIFDRRAELRRLGVKI